MSVYALVFLGLAPIGNSLIGMLADSIGTTRAVSVSAVICIVGSVLFMVRSYLCQEGLKGANKKVDS
jgi:nitrate/nitrite transporter NarK